MIAAIEIYNKPDFRYRDETFVILAVNSWELILKARILQLSQNRLSAILRYEKRRNQDGTLSARAYKVANRSGNPLSLGIFQAYDTFVNEYGDDLKPIVRKNIEALVEIRDNSVHFINEDLRLSKRIQEIGTATIKNYLRLIVRWFAFDLSIYHFYLMPLAFIREHNRAEAITLNRQEVKFLKFFESQNIENDDEAQDFNFSLDIEICLKKVSNIHGPAVRVTNDENALPVRMTEEDIRDRYPWSYTVLTKRLSKRYVDFKANKHYHDIRKRFYSDPRYCNTRYLDPGNPKSQKKIFFDPNIVKESDRHYTR